MTDDQSQIDDVVRTFFDAFTSGDDLDARLDGLRELLLPGAVVVRTCGDLTTYDVDWFVEPRRRLLSGGSLTDFREWEVDGTTAVFGDVAHRWCTYAKQWVEDGERRTGSGAKSIQLVRTAAGWRISALAWDDDR